MGILELAGQLNRDTEVCPHPGPRSSCAILVHGRRRDMVLCPQCLETFQELTRGYLAGQISPSEVVARMRALDYTRSDAARFVLELVALRIGVQLGFRKVA